MEIRPGLGVSTKLVTEPVLVINDPVKNNDHLKNMIEELLDCKLIRKRKSTGFPQYFNKPSGIVLQVEEVISI
ncbi:MAG: hypothetical protein ABH805_00415 [Candidatus Nealsonbacteria bacterium]